MPLRWSSSLRRSLVLYVIVPLLVATGAFSYVTLRAFEHMTEQRMEEGIELVARALQFPVSQALERGQASSAGEALQSVFSINRVYGAYVYDEEGELLAAAGSAGAPAERERPAGLGEEERRGAYEEVSGRAVYSYFVPLLDSGGRSLGVLQVTRRARDIRASIIRLRWQGAGVLLLAALVMVGLVLYGHHGAVGRHLDRLGASMGGGKQGERAHRAPEDGPGEIAALGTTLNTMLDSIAAAEQGIRRQRRTQTHLEAQLRHAEKLAAIGQLSAGVAHELGTPLSVIDGEAQRALRGDGLRGGDLPAPLVRRLQAVRREVRRMEHIVRQLLDFGRRHALQRRTVGADRLARMALGCVRERARRAGVTLELAPAAPPPTLSVDPILMERALANLLSNAIEAAPGGHVRLGWFGGEQHVGEQHVGFVVEDDGPGIPDDVAPRLFEPFFTTKDVGQGTGLGLAVVHGVVEEHGGRVEVGAGALGGACFRILLPAAANTPSEVDPPAEA